MNDKAKMIKELQEIECPLCILKEKRPDLYEELIKPEYKGFVEVCTHVGWKKTKHLSPPNETFRLSPDYKLPEPERWFFNPETKRILAGSGVHERLKDWIEISAEYKAYLETKPEPVDGFEWVLKDCQEHEVSFVQILPYEGSDRGEYDVFWVLIPVEEKQAIIDYANEERLMLEKKQVYKEYPARLPRNEYVAETPFGEYGLSTVTDFKGFAGVWFKGQKESHGWSMSINKFIDETGVLYSYDFGQGVTVAIPEKVRFLVEEGK